MAGDRSLGLLVSQTVADAGNNRKVRLEKAEEKRNKVKVCYKRHLSKSYMILEAEELWNETYELEMVSQNELLGILNIQTEIADGQIRFWYDITGRQTLADYLNRRKADSELLVLLFQTLQRVCEKTAEFLLDENSLLLEPEYIFLDMDCKRMECVYVPGYVQEIQNSFRELMELLLRKLDHSDKAASDMGYEVYQMTLEGTVDFYDLLRRIPQTTNQRIEEESEELYPEKEEQERKKRGKQEPEKNESKEERRFSSKKWKIPEQAAGSSKTGKRLYDLRTRICRFISILQENRKTAGMGAAVCRYKKEKEESPCYVVEKEQEISHPTELLSGGLGIQGILVYQGEPCRGNLQINKPVYLIGKQEQEVDGCVEGKSISRIHARIEQVDGAYYIEDMNSTNGTYLNGEILEYRQKVRLEYRDRVTFGMEEYIFL